MSLPREILSVINRRFDILDRSIASLKKDNERVDAFLRNQQPAAFLYPVPKPSQKDMGRSRDASKLLRGQIESENSMIPDGMPKHVPFPSHLADDRVNKDAVRILEPIMYRHMSKYIGNLTFEMVRDRHRPHFDKVMVEAGMHPQLQFFHQAAGNWAIEMLVSERMKTIMKTKKKDKSEAEIEHEDVDYAEEFEQENHRNTPLGQRNSHAQPNVVDNRAVIDSCNEDGVRTQQRNMRDIERNGDSPNGGFEAGPCQERFDRDEQARVQATAAGFSVHTVADYSFRREDGVASKNTWGPSLDSSALRRSEEDDVNQSARIGGRALNNELPRHGNAPTVLNCSAPRTRGVRSSIRGGATGISAARSTLIRQSATPPSGLLRQPLRPRNTILSKVNGARGGRCPARGMRGRGTDL